MSDIFLPGALPVAIGPNGSQTTLLAILQQAYGSEVAHIGRVYFGYYSSQDLNQFNGPPPAKPSNFSYWDPIHPKLNSVLVSGHDYGPDVGRYIDSGSFGNVTLVSGNAIMGSIYMYVEVGTNGADHIYQRLNVKSLGMTLISGPGGGTANPFDGIVNPSDVVAAAEAYARQFNGVDNINDCHFIAATIAAAAGATFVEDGATQSANPAENVEAGFWRIVDRGSDNPRSDWSRLVQPGDIVRFAYTTSTADRPSMHTFTVVQGARSSDGKILVVDNTNTDGADTDSSYISEHWVNFDATSKPDSVTIYRLTPDHLYLINGSPYGDVLLGTVWADDLRGLGGVDTLFGGYGNDVIDGGAGHDVLYGGKGDDLYHLYDVAGGTYDTVNEDPDSGVDTVWVHQVQGSGVSTYTLPTWVENGALTDPHASGFWLIGNKLDNTLYDDIGGNGLFGGEGNDSLYGGWGTNQLYGGAGQDSLYSDSATDFLVGGGDNDIYYLRARGADGKYATVIEYGGEGDNDWTYVTPIHVAGQPDSYTLYPNVENGMLMGSSNFDLVGNSAKNTLIGNSGDNHIYGGDNDDILFGGAGNDTLYGGAGNDTYFLQDLVPGSGQTLGHYDTVVEGLNGGIDTVYVTPFDIPNTNFDHYTLEANVENGTLLGSGSIELYGNDLANILTGNDSSNIIGGRGGNDTIYGGGGTDYAVFLFERVNYSIRRVDTGGVTSWIVSDNTPGSADGTATLYSIEYLGFDDNTIQVSKLIGALSDADANANAVIEGAAAGTLVGITAHATDGSSEKVVYGLTDDAGGAFKIDIATGVVTVADGSLINYDTAHDKQITVRATSVDGSFTLQQFTIGVTAVSKTLTGTPGKDAMTGGGGSDFLTGGPGKDTQTGGLGADHFIFNKVSDSRPGAGHDIITDFTHDQGDLIDLSRIDANSHLHGNQAFKFIAGQQFHHRSGELRVDSHKGLVQADVNGDGRADFEIAIANHAHLLKGDFIL